MQNSCLSVFYSDFAQKRASKLIAGKLTPTSGEVEITDKTEIAYYAQELELLDEEKSILDNFYEDDISPKKMRSILGRFLFTNDDVFKKVKI